jgi:hypothetical protein
MTRILLLLFALLGGAAHAQVHMKVDGACNWMTLRADGSVLGTSADLQSAINEAQASGQPLIVDGRRQCPINVAATTTFGPANGSSYTLRNVYLNSTVYPVVKIDTMYVSSLDWKNGEINYTGPVATTWPSTVVRITPDGAIPDPAPDEPYPIFKFSPITLPKLNNRGGLLYTVVLFDQPHGATVNNDAVRFQHVNGNCTTTNGITVLNPPAADPPIYSFVQNVINFGLVDAFLSTGIQEGSGPASGLQPLGTNWWRGAITTSCDVAAYAGFQTFGVMSQIYLTSISYNVGTLQYGVFFSTPSAYGNLAILPQSNGGASPATWCAGNGINGNRCLMPPY